MNNTNRMVSVPCELLEQALDAAAAVGMQDVADELDRILTPSSTERQDSTAVLWRHRENKPGRVWNYTEHKAVAEIAIRREQEVQGFADARETERLSEENLHYRNLQIEADDLITSLRAQLDTLRAQLAEQDALLRDAALHASWMEPNSAAVLKRIKAALSASAEPSDSPGCTWTFTDSTFAWGTSCSNSFTLMEDGPRENGMEFCPYCSKSIIQMPTNEELEAICEGFSKPARQHQAAPTPKTIPATLMQAMENLAVRSAASNHPPFLLPASARQAPLVMLGGVCLRVSYSGLKWYHDQLINDRWEPLSVDEFEALLTIALQDNTQGSNP